MLPCSSTLGAYRCFLRGKFSLSDPLVFLSIWFPRIKRFGHLYYVPQIFFDKKPFAHPYSCYSVLSSFSLSLPTLQLCILFPPPLSPTTLEFPLCLGRIYFLVRKFLRRIHIRSMILFSVSASFGFTIHSILVCYSFSVVTTIIYILSSSSFRSISVSGLVCFLCAAMFLAQPLWATLCFLPPLTFVHPITGGHS